MSESNLSSFSLEQPVITRFAPSPTGELHLGNARTALFAWLAARRSGGQFRLRIEDTDAERSVREHAHAILDLLQWLGLHWDGEVRHQSEHAPRHLECFAQLAAAGQAEKVQGALRLKVKHLPASSWTDLIRGGQKLVPKQVGDFVIQRSDGSSVFIAANAIDDADMGMTLVLRGEDHLSNTARQQLLLQALNLPAPHYGHLPLLVEANGKPLSKRDGSRTVAGLRAAGWLPLAVCNFLARLGCSAFEERLLSMDELAAQFDLARVARSPAQVDEGALQHWQRLALDALDEAAWWAWSGLEERVGVDRSVLIAGLRPNCLLPGDAQTWAQVLAAETPELSAEAQQVLAETAPAFFTVALAQLDQDPAQAEAAFGAYAKQVAASAGVKGKALFHPFRAALTGRLDGPELGTLARLLGAARMRQRLAQCAQSIIV
jgi:nondiscriminating glutamyl-tRNA synthetase